MYGSSLGFGSGIAALGASIPQLARGLGVAETSTGQFFTYRGVGVMFGACVSAKLLESPNSYLSKPFICCLGILVAGLALGLVPVVADAFPGTAMDLVKFLFALEGASFGVVESYSAVAISEMWGQRQQPWMQAKNLMSGSGAIVAPVLISYFGYEMAYILIGCIGFLSVVGLAVENMVVFTSFRKIDENDSDQIRLLRKETFRSLRSSPIAHQGLHSESSNFDCGSALGFVDDVALQADELDVISGSLHVINENEELDEPEVRHNIIGDILESKDLKIPRLESVDGEEFASRNRTLSYATPQILEQMNGKTETFNITLLSPLVRFLLGFFASWHIGLLYSYGGWVGTYVILSGIDGSKHQGSEAAALFVTTIFYTFQTIGSIYSVPASVFFSTTALMRFQLTLLVISTLLLIFAFSPYTFTALSSGFMGLALSCIYPLALTVVNDYGATM